MRGRPLKFTPAVFEQVQQWVAEGYDRDQIANQLGTSVGSLQVSCCRRGISLRVSWDRKPKHELQLSLPFNSSPIAETNESFDSPIADESLGTYALVWGEKTIPFSLPRQLEAELILDAMMRDKKVIDHLAHYISKALEHNGNGS